MLSDGPLMIIIFIITIMIIALQQYEPHRSSRRETSPWRGTRMPPTAPPTAALPAPPSRDGQNEDTFALGFDRHTTWHSTGPSACADMACPFAPFPSSRQKVKTDAFALRFDCRSAVHQSRSGVVLQCTRIPCTTVPLHYTSPDMACACTQARARRRRRPAKVTCVSVGRCRKLGSLLYAYTFACSYTYNT